MNSHITVATGSIYSLHRYKCTPARQAHYRVLSQEYEP